MKEMECINCGGMFKDYVSNHRKYCSKKCVKSASLLGKFKECEVCNKTYYSVRGRMAKQRFCSRNCKNTYVQIYGGWTKGKKGFKSGNAGSFKKGEHRNPATEFDGSYSGSKHWNWKGGITKEHDAIRTSAEIKKWKKAVFERDNYVCQLCGARNGNGKTITFNADHIKPFAYYPELRLDLDNGRTLCIDCHRNTDTYAGRAFKYA